MFGSKKSGGKPQARIDSLVGTGTRIDGDVTFSGGLRVDGEVRGSVTGSGSEGATLVVSEQAVIEGEIRVAHVVVNGTVKGPIYASESLELQPRCRVTGDVHYASVEMHLGAVVDGRFVHGDGGHVTDARTVELKLAATN